MTRYFRAALVFLILAFAAGPEAATRRIVAIADIHGDYDSFVLILRRAGLLDSSLRWSGGTATLVQTGDYTDRGPKTRAVLDLLMDLQKDASRQGGRVMVLLGNHEVMNIIGDLRYVTDTDYASFTDAKSEQRRKQAYQAYAGSPNNSLPEAAWMQSHPPGFVEHREAFGPTGKYGRWLRSLPAIAQIDDTIFLHGGISPELADWNIRKLNETITTELKAFDAYKKYMVDEKIALPFFTLDELAEAASKGLKERSSEDPDRKRILESFLQFGNYLGIHPQGVLWYRGYAQWSETEGEQHIKTLTEAFKASRFVVGHTVQPQGRIVSRFGGRIVLIDTGMLGTHYPGGRPSALEIMDGKVTPIYP